MKFHYKKVLYITVEYSNQLHETGKESRWLCLIEHDFPDAAKKFVEVKQVTVKTRRVYDQEKAKQ